MLGFVSQQPKRLFRKYSTVKNAATKCVLNTCSEPFPALLPGLHLLIILVLLLQDFRNKRGKGPDVSEDLGSL